ncbi:MAG: cytochrome c oxidase subunit II [Planctomycetes bacterium]|nr:cytochrome c oxidase subunit II [Planctomycetota bacterium]
MSDLSLGSLSGLPLAEAGGSFWFPPESSSIAAGSDFVYDLILWLCIIFFVLICGATLYFMVKYRKRPGHKEEVTSTHNTRLELAWSVIPLLLLMVVFGVSTYWYVQFITPPNEDVHQVDVEAKRWNWTFKYRDKELLGPDKQYTVVGELLLIKDRNYQIVMTAPDNDVIHSFFVPAFRVKQDCVPGRYNKLWFRPTEASPPEGFNMFCTEYCGDDHSKMLARVHVYETEAEWAAAVQEKGNIGRITDLVERGKVIYDQNCKSCHSVDGSRLIGPSWKGLWGKKEEMEDGSTFTVDKDYVRESVLVPNKHIVKGYPDQMTAFVSWGDQEDAYFEGIYAYMESLKD